MNIPTSCDVLVIGGGPSGSLTATYLRQQGYHVVLLERQKQPRPHVGESMLPHIWKYLDLAKATDKILAAGFVKKSGGVVKWRETIRKFTFRDFGYERPPFHAERDTFDHILLENAREHGAQVFEQVAVQAVSLPSTPDQTLRPGTQAVQVRYQNLADRTVGEIAAHFVIDASGQNAMLARAMGTRVIDESFRFMSIWGYFQDSKYVSFDGKIYPFHAWHDHFPATFVSSIPDMGDIGWVWHIPLREVTSVGLVIPMEFIKVIKQANESWEGYFLRKCADIPVIQDLLQNAQFCPGSVAQVQDYSYRSTTLAGPGFFLVGDAGGFIDPIFSVGVLLGMHAAYLAAWAIDRSFQKPATSGQNQELYTRQMQGRFELSRTLALPRYQPQQQSALAESALKFESTVEQELMGMVAMMTTRSDNFQEISIETNGHKIIGDKFYTIDELEFA